MDGLLCLGPTVFDLEAGVGTVRVGLVAALGRAVLGAGLGDSPPALMDLESEAFRGTGWGLSISSKDDTSLRVRREGGALAALAGADIFLAEPLGTESVVALLGLLDAVGLLASEVVLLGTGVVLLGSAVVLLGKGVVLLGSAVVLLGNGVDLIADGVGLLASVVEFKGLPADFVGDVGLLAVETPPSLADLLL